MTRLRRWLLWFVAAVAAVLGAFVGVFLMDSVLHGERIARNVTVNGVYVGSLDDTATERFVEDLAAEAMVRPLRIDGGDYVIDATLADVGITLDKARLRAELEAAGSEGSFVDDLRSWYESFSQPRVVELHFVADPVMAQAFVAAQPQTRPYEPVEPSYTGATGSFVVQSGSDGLALDPAAAGAAIAGLAGTGYPDEVVAVTWEPVPPRIDEAALAASLAEAESLAVDLPVAVNGHVGTIEDSMVATWIDSTMVDFELVPRFDYERAEADVQQQLADFIDPGTPPVFTVVDGEVNAVLGEEPMKCCEPGFAVDLEAAARNGRTVLTALPPTPVYDDAGLAAMEAMGIEELVGQFTTNHRCCQSRVDNIHRIADLVRGVVIEPGGSFSINDFVGRRTRDKGFVSAGVIQSGHFVDDVGGGISQFATTMFNAAFFAGLDLDEYQSHSIYISRYPYGREATLSFPQPDLVVSNPTPYAVLVWTSYTDTSITVSMYSTPYFDVAQTGQSTSRAGACRRVNTFRARTAPDGEVLEDSVFATYRPGEGLDCAGNRIPEPD